MDTHACKRGVDYRIYASDSQLFFFFLALVHVKNIFLLRSAKSLFFLKERYY